LAACQSIDRKCLQGKTPFSDVNAVVTLGNHKSQNPTEQAKDQMWSAVQRGDGGGTTSDAEVSNQKDEITNGITIIKAQ
jgi:hypothetical protein